MSASGSGTIVSTRRVLNGRYAVGEVIGWGGIAKVHLALSSPSPVLAR